MNEPRRLLETRELPSDAHDLLARARTPRGPTAAEQQKILSGVVAGAGGGPGSGAPGGGEGPATGSSVGASSPSGLSSSLGGTAVVAKAVVGVGGASLVLASALRWGPELLENDPSPAVPERRAIAEEPTSPDPEPTGFAPPWADPPSPLADGGASEPADGIAAPGDRTSVRRRPPPRRGLSPPPAARASSKPVPSMTDSTPGLATEAPAKRPDEVALIDGARSTMRSDPDASLQRLARHLESHPDGMLADERDLLWARILIEQGEREAAQSILRRLRTRSPESPYVRALESKLGE